MTGGRRAALIIGVPVCLALVAWTALGLVSNIGEGTYPVNYALPAGVQSVHLSMAAGTLTVRPTTASRATVSGTAHYSLARSKVTESTTSSGTTIGYRCPIPLGDCELDATVSVPAALPVWVNTDGGDVTVSGITRPVTLSTSGGNVTAEHTSGPLTLSTGGGDINATDVGSPSITTKTSGGNIDATGISAQTVTATSGGGDVTFYFASVPRSVDVTTAGGNITLVLPAGDTRYSVSTSTAGGNVNDSLPATQGPSANKITAKSGGGNITITQQ
jgi:hypothetical protein